MYTQFKIGTNIHYMKTFHPIYEVNMNIAIFVIIS